jgi:hypothetical protein
MPLLRLAQAFQEIVRLRLLRWQCYRRPNLHRQTEFMRAVRHRPAAFALTAFKFQVAHQAIDAFLECFSARDLDPIAGPWQNCRVDEIV